MTRSCIVCLALAAVMCAFSVESAAAQASATAAEASSSKPVKLALLVGINEYEDTNIRSLRGALNDVARMEQVLAKFDFPDGNVLPLRNKEATRKGILDAFRDHLLNKTVPGRNDVVVFYYSGHGSQVPDERCGDESDRLDETLVPWDSHNEGANDITDDDINDLLEELSARTRNITLVVDSCSSGDVHRGVGVARRVQRQHELPERCTEGEAKTAEAEMGKTGLKRKDVRFALLSAARSNELAREYQAQNGRVYGVFTYFLTEELLRAPENATYRDVLDVVKQSVKNLYPTQNVELEGTAADSLVFGATDVLQENYVRVKPTANPMEVELEGGQIHGLTEGSVFEIYPPRTRVFPPSKESEGDAEKKSLAFAELTDVRADRSTAKLLSAGAIPQGSRAVEREHRYQDRELWVRFVGEAGSPELGRVKQTLSQLEIVREAPAPSQSDADRYHLLLEHVRKNGESHILLEAADGAPVARWRADEPGVAELIATEVKKWAKWFNVLSISNPSPRVRIEFAVQAVTTKGQTRSPFANVERPDAEFFEGEKVRVLIKNRSRYDLYLSILDLSTDGSVSLVYENKQPSLKKGQTEPFGLELETFLPEEFDFVTDTLMVFASRDYADLKFLEKESLVTKADSELERLVARAAGGTRGPAGALPLDGWTTAKRIIRVVRRAR